MEVPFHCNFTLLENSVHYTFNWSQKIQTNLEKSFFFPQNDVQLVKEGDKVGASEATLLNMLNISPFTYGLVVQQVYDQGTVFSPRVLDITDEDLIKSFQDVSFI